MSTSSGIILVKGGDGATLRLSGTNGAVLSMTGSDGAERLATADEAFTLQLLDGAGEPTRLASSAFSFAHADGHLEWRHPNGLRVGVEVSKDDGGGFRFRPSVDGIPEGMLLEWFDGPHVCIRRDRTLLWPYWDGCEVTDYSQRDEWRPVGYVPRGKGSGSVYPGICQMQFLAAYGEGSGVYFSAVDPRHVPKGVEWERVGGDRVRLSLQTFCGDLDGKSWRPAFHYLLRPYGGGWMEACEIYRDWVRTLPGFDRPPERPEWMRDSPVTLIYPVRGEGIDHGPNPLAPNCYFPFARAMPTIRKYGDMLDSRVMALLMHWEGTAPWCPPYVWPPLGGEEGLAALRDALHARGDLLGVYCSGTAWTQVSCTELGYSRERMFADEGLARWMVRGPKGEIEAAICNGPSAQRFGYEMCVAEEWPARILEAELLKMGRFGIDYCQFFDQNLGGGWERCYSREHSHPPIPGAWHTDAMLALQARLRKALEREGSDMSIGCEGAAATPFAPNLAFNDGRMWTARVFGRPVPALAFVFHEWTCNFSGNMNGVRDCDPFHRWLACFHNGDMLSLVLGPDGHLSPAWGLPWTERMTERDEEELVSLVRRLNALRRKYTSFLLEGRMIRPFARCESRPARLSYNAWWKVDFDVREVLTSFWENEAGERIGFASNWRREPSELTVAYPDGRMETHRLAPLETIVLAPGES